MRRQLNVKLLAWLLVGLTVAGVGTYFLHEAQVRRNAGSLRTQAERYLADGQLQDAISYLGQYLVYEPGDTQALAVYALALDQAADSPAVHFQAWELLEQAIRRAPARSDWRREAVRMAVALGYYADAARHLEVLLQTTPHDAALATLLGRCRENTGEYDKAAKAYSQAVRDNPKLLDAAQRLAHVLHFHLERPGQARKALDHMVAANPRSVEALLIRARFLQEIGAVDRAWEDIGRPRALAPDQLDVLLAGAELAQVRGDASTARSFLERGLKGHPDDVRLYQMLSWLEQQAGRNAEAAAVLRRGLEKAPNSPDLLLGLADVLADSDPKIATEELDRARQAGAAAAAVNSIQARLLAQQGKWNKVQALLKAARPGQPFPNAWQARADLDSRLRLLDLAVTAGRDREAKLIVADLRQREGEDGVLWREGEASRLLVLARQGRGEVLPEARKLLDDVARRRQGDSRLALLQAAVADLSGNPDSALAFYLQALSRGATRSDVVRRAVQLLYQAGRYDEADEVIRVAEQRAPLDGELTRRAAQVALKRGQLQRACKLARSAVPAKTRDYRDHLWLAHMLEAAGQPAQAEASLRRAVRLAASVPEPWLALVRHLARQGRAKEAEEVLQQAQRKLSPTRAERMLPLGEEALGRLDRADALYQKQLQAHPGDPAVLRAAADFYLRIGRGDQAEPLLRHLADPLPGAPPAQVALARRQLAVLLAESSRPAGFDQALAMLDQNVKASGPSAADEEARAAVLAVQPQRRRDAIRLLEQLHSRHALSAKGQYLLVRLYEADGQPSRASNLMLDLLVRTDDEPEYLAHQVRTLLSDQELTQARTYLDRLERIEPHSLRTRQLMEAFRQAQGMDP
jgi:predicted Zn-dependent protease